MLIYRLGDTNTHLVGVAHVLPAGAGELPPKLLELHEGARVVVVEWPFDDSGAAPPPIELPSQTTLRRLVPLEVYEAVSAAWSTYGIEGKINRTVPWWVTRQLGGANMRALGYGPGQDVQLWNLTTIKSRLRFLDDEHAGYQMQRVSIDDHTYFLRQAGDLAAFASHLERVTLPTTLPEAEARTAFEELHAEMSAEVPTFAELVITARNAAWLPKITACARGTEPALVLVGALHLVGPVGLLELLEIAGFPPVAV